MDISVPLGTAISGAILSISYMVVRLRWQVLSERYPASEFKDGEFYASKAAFILPCLGALPGAVMIHLASIHPNGRYLLAPLGIACWLSAIYLFHWVLTSKVIFKEGWVEYREGKKITRFKLNDIEEVEFDATEAVVSMKDKRKVRISLYFRNNTKLLAMLKRYRPENVFGSGDPRDSLS